MLPRCDERFRNFAIFSFSRSASNAFTAEFDLRMPIALHDHDDFKFFSCCVFLRWLVWLFFFKIEKDKTLDARLWLVFRCYSSRVWLFNTMYNVINDQVCFLLSGFLWPLFFSVDFIILLVNELSVGANLVFFLWNSLFPFYYILEKLFLEDNSSAFTWKPLHKPIS